MPPRTHHPAADRSPPRAARPAAAVLPAALLMAVMLVLAAGCANQPTEGDRGEREARTLPTEIGIESRVWTINAALGPFLRALGEASFEASDLAPAERLAWREAGLRLVDLPADGIDQLESIAPHTDAVRRVWLGQPTRWTTVASRRAGPAGSAGSPETGLQLLARSWVEPDVRRGPVFRVELAVVRTLASTGEARPRPELLLSQSLERGRALVIVPADPTEDWTAPEDPAPGDEDGTPGPDAPDDPGSGSDAAEPGDPGAGVAPIPPPLPDSGGSEVGPRPPALQTIGESLLLTPPDLSGSAPRPARREVIVIIPRWPVP